MIQLTDQPIETADVLASVQSPEAGAVVLFLGTTRGVTDGVVTESLDYECYPAMAEKKLAALEADARRRWPGIQCAVVHRLGHVGVGEASVAIAVSSVHRKAAFEAGEWLIDQIKKVVPIWKREQGEDGSQHWVHPGVEDLA